MRRTYPGSERAEVREADYGGLETSGKRVSKENKKSVCDQITGQRVIEE